MEQEPVYDGAEWLTFTDDKNRGTSNIQTKGSRKHAVNYVFAEQNAGKERRNFSLCTRIIKP